MPQDRTTEYAVSIESPESYWANLARDTLTFDTPFTRIKQGSQAQGKITWFEDGELNACANCVDRHLPTHADKKAIIFEGDEPTESTSLTYAELYKKVCVFANVLKTLNIHKGDRVCLYMPMIPEAVIAMLACARIGAIHSVVFGGFSSEALASRIDDAGAKCVITVDISSRGGKPLALKQQVDKASLHTPSLEHVLVIRQSEDDIAWNDALDKNFATLAATVSHDCPYEIMNAEDPLFILYTSGSTGKPKGVCHTTAGYLLYASVTHRRVFDLQSDDIYWCTADVGWITGHSYIVYGPLLNAATTVIFAGVPTYPDVSRFWQVIDKHQVSVFYTAPTALRSLMRAGDAPIQRTSRQSLRVLGTVGEPINPEVWQWYYDVVGDGRCDIVDTWWQTETGGILISPLANQTPLKPGSATLPFFGIEPALMDENAKEIEGEGTGKLVIKQSWPGQMRTVYGDHQRFIDTYLSDYPGYYFTGDLARRDSDGYYWIIGRTDDVLNVSGHRLGTAEIESALVSHPKISEAAVVGVPDPITGEAIVAFASLMKGAAAGDNFLSELNRHLREKIGPIAKLKNLTLADDLPKTRSGKIMRRILRQLANGKIDELGDTSTLADPGVIDKLKHMS